VRIAIVGPTHPYKGGIAQYTTELAHRLSGTGHDVRIESWRHQYPKLLYPGQLTIAEPETTPFPQVSRTLSWRRPDSWYRVGRRLRGADVVILVVGTPIQAPAYRGILAGLGRARRPRVVAQCHNVLPHERRGVDVHLIRGLLSRVDGVLTHAESQETIARQLTSRTIVTQPMAPIVVARRAISDPDGDESVHRRLLFFGIVRPYKGLDVLLEALARCPIQIQLRVAGEFWGGADQTRRLVTDLGLEDAVELRPGYVDAVDVPALFTDVDALVLPYRAGTASFTAYLAFEHGRPVIATRAGTAAFDVRDGVDGLLCEPDDADSLADVITRFYADGVPQKLRAAVRTVDPAPAWNAYESALLRAANLDLSATG
jgi:glycosyltransferase involved in cell wall biosynthesis